MTKDKWNVGDYNSLHDMITKLEQRVSQLETENIGTTNTLYEILNTLDEIKWHYQNQKKTV